MSNCNQSAGNLKQYSGNLKQNSDDLKQNSGDLKQNSGDLKQYSEGGKNLPHFQHVQKLLRPICGCLTVSIPSVRSAPCEPRIRKLLVNVLLPTGNGLTP